MARITEVNFFWNQRNGAAYGWYAEATDGVNVVQTSKDRSFPVNVRTYYIDEPNCLRAALASAFPDANVIHERGTKRTGLPDGPP
jgi:hypothetical protein